MKSTFYITTPIFYVNSEPHIGAAFTLILSDVVARVKRLQGADVYFLTGTDEHGAKILQASEKSGESVEQFTDRVSGKFRDLTTLLNISNTYFIRTTDKEVHQKSVIKLWNELVGKGDIYKGNYEGLYCVGCESYKKVSDLIDGLCPDHKTAPSLLKEENYFFKLSNYTEKLKELYKEGVIIIKPQSRTNEVLQMLEDSEDISFSRPQDVVKWGIPVPGDESQLIYVWADALTNYLSAIGYGRNEEWKKWWPADVHVIGKDILRFHSITWPAMLLSLGLATPKTIFAHGHLTVDGQKMSKSLGNVVNPFDLAKKYPIDVIRYFLIREISSSEDGDFSEEKLRDRYRGDLAHNLGNLVSRVMTLIETKCDGVVDWHNTDPWVHARAGSQRENIIKLVENFKLNEALSDIWSLYSFLNAYLNEKKPWDKESKQEDVLMTLSSVSQAIYLSLEYLEPFMPDTARRIKDCFAPKSDGIFSVSKPEALFPLDEK